MFIKLRKLSPLLYWIVAFLVYPFLASLVALGMGMALNLITHIGLLPCTAIFIATFFTGITATGLYTIATEVGAARHHEFEDEDEDEDVYELGDLDERKQERILQTFRDVMFKKPKSSAQQTTRQVGRNEPCPCGSEKKFKLCCLNKSEGLNESIPF